MLEASATDAPAADGTDDMPSELPSRRGPMVLHARVVTGTGGGPDKTILNSPQFLLESGYRSVCAFLRPPGDAGFATLRQRASAARAPLEEIDDRGPLDWRILPRLLRLCRLLEVDIWHAHDYKTNLLGVLLARKHPMRLVTTVHGWVEYTPRTRLYYQLDRLTLPRYERVICVSHDLVERCRSLGVAAGKTLLVENAVDTTQFRRTSDVAEAKRRLDWPAQRLLIGAAGRLSNEKRFNLLIRAIAELVRRQLDVGLILAGDGRERQPLQRLVDELDLGKRVRLVGFQSDLRPLYEAFDLFVLSSVREGLPNVLLEAMALEVPVVATRVAGIPRLIIDGENGLLVAPGDVGSLAGAMERLLLDAQLRRRLAATGRQSVEQRHSFAARMKKVAAVYDELLTSGSRPKA